MRHRYVLQNIEEEMRWKGLNRRMVGERVGLTQQSISGKLLGRVNVSVDDLIDFAKALDVPICKLLEPPKPKPPVRRQRQLRMSPPSSSAT